MNILTTGASGFLGPYLTRFLLKNYPKASLHSVGREPLQIEGSKHHILDLTNESAVRNLIETVRPSLVFHLAGNAKISEKFDFKSYFFQNTLTTQIVLEELVKLDQPVAFFLTSSMHVYGNQTQIINETSEARPESAYAFTKLLAEECLKSLTQKHSHLKGVVGRLYSCFGPGQPLGFVAADVCAKIEKLKQENTGVLKVGPIDTFRRFIDVRDAVRIFPTLLSSNLESRFEIFNIASPNELTIKNMIETLLKIANLKVKIESSGDANNQFKGLRIDISKLEKRIPIEFFRPVEETLYDMLHYH